MKGDEKNDFQPKLCGAIREGAANATDARSRKRAPDPKSDSMESIAFKKDINNSANTLAEFLDA